MSKAKDIHIETRPLIPRDIIESDLSLQSYLAENLKENKKHEMIRLRSAKAVRIRKNNLEQNARQITISVD
jgi:hypothetical protein